MSDDWGWVCTDGACMFGCLTEQSKEDHEEQTGHDMREVDT